jgi:hypothetical protein
MDQDIDASQAANTRIEAVFVPLTRLNVTSYETVQVRRSDWEALRDSAAGLTPPWTWWPTLASAACGLGATALAAGLAEPRPTRQAIWLGAAITMVVALILCLVAHRRERRLYGAESHDLLARLAKVEKMWLPDITS